MVKNATNEDGIPTNVVSKLVKPKPWRSLSKHLRTDNRLAHLQYQIGKILRTRVRDLRADADRGKQPRLRVLEALNDLIRFQLLRVGRRVTGPCERDTVFGARFLFLGEEVAGVDAVGEDVV